jgi:hypothetical protein
MEIQHSLNGQADLGTQLLVPRNASLRAFEMVGSGNTGGVFWGVFSTRWCWEWGCGRAQGILETAAVVRRKQLHWTRRNVVGKLSLFRKVLAKYRMLRVQLEMKLLLFTRGTFHQTTSTTSNYSVRFSGRYDFFTLSSTSPTRFTSDRLLDSAKGLPLWTASVTIPIYFHEPRDRITHIHSIAIESPMGRFDSVVKTSGIGVSIPVSANLSK